MNEWQLRLHRGFGHHKFVIVLCKKQLIQDVRVREAFTLKSILFWTMVSLTLPVLADESTEQRVDFVRDIQPLFQTHCIKCHGEVTAKSGLRLDLKAMAFAGGDSGAIVVPKDSHTSLLFKRIADSGADRMPPEGEPLTAVQIDLVKRWIDQGAVWPDHVDKVANVDKYDWWSLRPLVKPDVPKLDVPSGSEQRVTSPIDAFIQVKLREKGLSPSPEADRRTLARRLYFDLIGLPPTPEEMETFVRDPDPNAYGRLVETLLESPHYGERWARHWLDVVHYGDTHGYDKDKPRPNAWPYRDYVIRSLNDDKPYWKFVMEQIAGDVLWPHSEDGITATGFIAAGPWDFIGHAEVPESKIDGKIARNLDRDDMVSNVCNTFLSLTVQCARCHNHKFDPVTQENYYRLQAVFAALDRADRPYDIDPNVARQRVVLVARRKQLQEQKQRIDSVIAEAGGDALKQLEGQIAVASKSDKHPQSSQFGYHSQIEAKPDNAKWVQVDLGERKTLNSIQIVGCHDDFNGIGAGFGFPVRFKIEISDDPSFAGARNVVVDRTTEDFANPGTKLLTFPVTGQPAQFVRITATRLAARQNDYCFALAELLAIDSEGKNAALGRPVQSGDSIESAPRWRQANLVDGYYIGVNSMSGKSVDELKVEREQLIASVLSPSTRSELQANSKSLDEVSVALAKLPVPNQVYAGTIYSGSGSFVGTGATGGKPREIRILARGDVVQPLGLVEPGTVPLSRDSSGDFGLPNSHSEGQRRIALARWIVSKDNPLTWRSIVNRVWQYHFGRGIVDSPNDFGRMGQLPTHPELLDWLAVDFREGRQGLKRLHKLIVTSSTYRQTSLIEKDDKRASTDSNNSYLWRMNRRKLDAESIRDATLAVSGKLNRQLGGPAFQDFVVEKPEHSPHYEYRLYDPEDERCHRRSVYRFLVRSQPQPFMTTLDCADASMSVDKRSETVTALQALALLNNRLMLTMANHMTHQVESQSSDLSQQVDLAFKLALTRPPTTEELEELSAHAKLHGIRSLCRLLMNLNEFVFVD